MSTGELNPDFGTNHQPCHIGAGPASKRRILVCWAQKSVIPIAGKKNRGCSINMTQEAPKKALKFEGENKIPQKTTYHTNLQLFLNMSPKNGIPWKMICAKSRQNKQKCLYTFIQSYHFGCFFFQQWPPKNNHYIRGDHFFFATKAWIFPNVLPRCKRLFQVFMKTCAWN